MPAGAVYVGRPTRWGNPWTVTTTRASTDTGGDPGPATDVSGSVASRAEAVRRYRHYLASRPDLIADAREQLAGRILVCWCPLTNPDGTPTPCHADVLWEVANHRETEPVGTGWEAGEVATRRLIPDLDDELCIMLDQVEEVLLTLARWEETPAEPEDQMRLPGVLSGRVALRALERLQDAIRPTQTRTHHSGQRVIPPAPEHRGRLLGPDGHYEHRPLRLVEVTTSDLVVLSQAAATMGQALATTPHSELAEAITVGAEAAGGDGGPPVSPTQIVEGLARAVGLLDLTVTEDTTALTTRLDDARGADVVLTPPEERAYQRLVDRFNTMWTSSSGLDRFLY